MSNVTETYGQLQININTDLKLAVLIDDVKFQYNIYDIYNPASSKGGNVIVNYYGNFSRNNGLKVIYRNKSLIWSRKNMTGVTLKAATVVSVLL